MSGNDKVRFCEHCQLEVNDLTSLTPKRIRRLMTKSKGRLCVRYHRCPDGKPLIRRVPGKLHQISKRFSRVAAGVFTATLSLGSATGQQSTSSVTYQRAFTVEDGSVPVQLGTTISGKISDTKQAAIEGAGIMYCTTKRVSLRRLTNIAGIQLAGLVPGDTG